MTLMTRLYDIVHVPVDSVILNATRQREHKYCAVLPKDFPNGTAVLNKMVLICKMYGYDAFLIRNQKSLIFCFPGNSFCKPMFVNQAMLDRVIDRIETLKIKDVPKFKSFVSRRKWLFTDFEVDKQNKIYFSSFSDRNVPIATISDCDDIFIGHYLFTKKGENCWTCGKRTAIKS